MIKGEIFEFIISKLESFGWENISSNKVYTGNFSTATVPDAAVMYSNGINGDKDIFIRISPFCFYSSSACFSSVTPLSGSSTGNHIEIGLYERYTPGATDTNGVFVPPLNDSSAGRKMVAIYNISDAYGSQHTIPGWRVRVGATLDHFVVTIRPPQQYISAGPVIFGAGIYYGGFNRYADGSDTISWGNHLRNFGTTSTYSTISTSYHLYARRKPILLGATTNYGLAATIPIISKQPNYEGVYALSNITFGTSAEGPLGIIPIVKALQDPDPLLMDRVRISVGSKLYEVLYNGSDTNLTLPTKTLAIRVA
jgi:hypothetical protein